eukprot:scaffold285_cov330-Pavlova_lutheri.AAC.133
MDGVQDPVQDHGGEEVSQKQTGRRPGRKGKHDPIDWESIGLEGAESAPLLRGDASVPGRKDGERTSKPTNPHVSFTQDNEQRNCTGGCFIPRLSAPLDHYTARLVAGVVKKPWWSLGARQEDKTSTRKDERKWTLKMRSTPSRGQRVCKGGDGRRAVRSCTRFSNIVTAWQSFLPPWIDVEQLFWRKVRLRCPGGVPTHKQVQVESPCRSNDEGLRTARMPSASAHVLSRTKRSHGWALQHPSQSCVWKLARLEPSLECHAHPSERPSGSLIGHSRT